METTHTRVDYFGDALAVFSVLARGDFAAGLRDRHKAREFVLGSFATGMRRDGDA